VTIVVILGCDEHLDGLLILFRPLPTLFMLEFRLSFHARQVFDEMLERAFIHGLGHLTYAEE